MHLSRAEALLDFLKVLKVMLLNIKRPKRPPCGAFPQLSARLFNQFSGFVSPSGRKCKPIFVQIARQVVKLNASDLRLPSRAWKVKLVGEGADDAGGVFDDTITEMCQVLAPRSFWFRFLESPGRC